jgi:RND family efflux transporter MFP subunit
MRSINGLKPYLPWLRYLAVGAGFAGVILVLMLWLAGRFSPKVPVPQATSRPEPGHVPPAGSVVEARAVTLPVTESAVGSIRAVHETSVASRLLAKVVQVNVTAGQRVKRDEVLVRLDDSDLRARLQQAQAGVARARAARAQAVPEEKRLADLRQSGGGSQVEYERAVAARKTAEAEVTRAEELVNEAQTVLGYATIGAPMDGVVVDKKVDVGDTVTPGQVLVSLYDPSRMQLVASVRESLAHRLQVGQPIGVHVDVLDKTCGGRVSEVVPEAQSASRTFQVKVTGPCPPGIYTGMFGRLLIPLDEESVVVIPRAAIRKVGQLELVDVVEDGGQVRRRAIRTGRAVGDDREVLSGLRAGERVVVPGAAGDAGAGGA